MIINNPMREERFVEGKELTEKMKTMFSSNDIVIDALYSVSKKVKD